MPRLSKPETRPFPNSLTNRLRQAVAVVRAGGIIAYPTEAVYGLGCDPLNTRALEALLALKQRPWHKGLIVIAADLAMLEPLLQPLDAEVRQRITATWPGPVTWVLPAQAWVPELLRGRHPGLAVRVTAHPLAQALCQAWGGPLVSTSANRSRQPPARSALQVRQRLGDEIDFLLAGEVDRAAQPSEIRDGLTGAVIRPGTGEKERT